MSLVAAKNGVLSLIRREQEPAPSPFTRAGEQDPLLGSSTGGSSGSSSRIRPFVDVDDDVESQSSTLHSADSQASTGPGRRVSARLLSDATIGLSDGLTVPFALTAGLSALDDSRVVIYGGLAELIAGAISMGLGGYLGAKSETASYEETLSQTNDMIAHDPEATEQAIRAVFAPYGLPKPTLDAVGAHLAASPDLASFLMRFHHAEPEPGPSRAVVSGLTIAAGYFLGGLLPLLPYLLVPGGLGRAFAVSVAVMAVALFAFGYAKTCLVCGWSGPRCVRAGLAGALQMLVVGGAAAAAAMLLVKAFNSLAEASGGGVVAAMY